MVGREKRARYGPHKAGSRTSSTGNTGLRLGLNPPTAAVRQDSICDCCLHLCQGAALLLEGQENDGWSRPSTRELWGRLLPWLAWQRGSGTRVQAQSSTVMFRNRYAMDSPLWIRRIASDRIRLMSTVLILGHCSFWTS